jgi:hypothetical protein
VLSPDTAAEAGRPPAQPYFIIDAIGVGAEPSR